MININKFGAYLALTFVFHIGYTPCAHAIDCYRSGETLHVWAQSGLNMRSAGNTEAEIIARIPYSDSLIVLVDKNAYDHNVYALSVFGSTTYFMLKGKWVRVKYGEREGYVVDIYLSRLPALQASERDKPVNYLSRLHPSLSRHAILLNDVKYSTDSIYTSGCGIIYLSSSYAYEDLKVISTPLFSKEEAYLFANAWLQLESTLSHEITALRPRVESESDNSLFIRLNEITYLSIEKTGAMATISLKVSE